MPRVENSGYAEEYVPGGSLTPRSAIGPKWDVYGGKAALRASIALDSQVALCHMYEGNQVC
jgi:hypothetical protein